MLPILEDFLDEHPEHRDDVRQFDVRGGAEDYVGAQALAALLRWVVERRGCDPEKVRAVWAGLKARHPTPASGPARCEPPPPAPAAGGIAP